MDRLGLATAGVLLILGYGLFEKVRPVSFGVALSRVVDGALEKKDWLSALRVLHAEGLRRAGFGDLLAGRIAASAAILLEDEPGYRQACSVLHQTLGLPKDLPGAGGYAKPSDLHVASLGEAMLERFLSGHVAQAAGDLDAARGMYRQAAGAALFRQSELGTRLIQEALQTLP